MSGTGFWIPLSEELSSRLSELPVFRQQVLIERAIEQALDAEGWPRAERGTVAVGAYHWYIVLSRHGEVRGHVGPIVGKEAAQRCALSWREGGTRAKLTRMPVGPCLTNAGLTLRDVCS